jgi:hypothetical protein
MHNKLVARLIAYWHSKKLHCDYPLAHQASAFNHMDEERVMRTALAVAALL